MALKDLVYWAGELAPENGKVMAYVERQPENFYKTYIKAYKTYKKAGDQDHELFVMLSQTTGSFK